MTTPAIEIKNLRFAYKDKPILKGIDLSILPGQIIGYIGPNGAGKSTTVKIMLGLLSGFEGEVRIMGQDVRKDPVDVKRLVGYVPENAELYDVLTPMEFLSFVGKLHDLPDEVIEERATRMLTYFGLKDRLNERMDAYSKGMKQKVLLASGLIHNPQILFLDEPLSGLDANAVILVKEIISRLAAEGKTIFYCSHMMDIVEKVSDRIIIISEGSIIADGAFEELRQEHGGTLERIFSQLTGKDDMEDNAAGFLESFKV